MTTKGWIIAIALGLIIISFMLKIISRKSEPNMADFAENDISNIEHNNELNSLTQNHRHYER